MYHWKKSAGFAGVVTDTLDGLKRQRLPASPSASGRLAPSPDRYWPSHTDAIHSDAAEAMSTESRIFLAHAREDKSQVRKLYADRKARGLDPWLDEADLMPGQIWRDEIPKAIRGAALLFLACLSSRSVAKVGYVQNEFRLTRIIHERWKAPICGTRVTVAPAARMVWAWRWQGRARSGGTRPRGSGRQRGGPSGEADPARLVRIARRQGHFDPGDHLGDPGGNFDQRQTNRVELGGAPERGLRRQTTQRVQEPVGGGVDQQAELIGRRAGAGGPI